MEAISRSIWHRASSFARAWSRGRTTRACLPPPLITASDGIGGIATSGWRGRSFSLGIADAVTICAATAADADAAATVVANAVDLPGHLAIHRIPAASLQPDSDLGDLPVTRNVGPLSPEEAAQALAAGLAVAEGLIRSGHVIRAALHCQGSTRVATEDS